MYYSRISKGSHKGNLVQILDSLTKNISDQEKELETIRKKCVKIENDAKLHIQKVGLIRFNPFKDTGGDQSFILAMVNAQDTGVVISSLHTRTGTRWYAKAVNNGKGVEYELSKDEEQAIKEAQAIT